MIFTEEFRDKLIIDVYFYGSGSFFKTIKSWLLSFLLKDFFKYHIGRNDEGIGIFYQYPTCICGSRDYLIIRAFQDYSSVSLTCRHCNKTKKYREKLEKI